MRKLLGLGLFICIFLITSAGGPHVLPPGPQLPPDPCPECGSNILPSN